MRKSDVEFHSDGFGRESRPAVNVKVYNQHTLDECVDLVAKHEGLPGFTMEWVERNLSDNALDEWFWETCRSGWEDLHELAREIFGRDVTVYSQGRSGGWVVVDGLPPFESWDAIDLGRWSRFAKIARTIADDVPYTMAVDIAINTYEAATDHDAQEIQELDTYAV